MPKYTVRVTDGAYFADIEVTSDSLIDACGHAIDQVGALDVLLDEAFELDGDDYYVDNVEDERGNDVDVPEQFIEWKNRTIAELQREVARLKLKCGEDK